MKYNDALKVQITEKARQETKLRDEIAMLEIPEGVKLDTPEYFRYKTRRDNLHNHLMQVGAQIESLKEEIQDEAKPFAPEDNSLELAEIANAEAEAQRLHEAAEKQAQREHEANLAKIELMKLKEQRLAAEAARDASAIAKAQESEQFAAILKSLKDNEG